MGFSFVKFADPIGIQQAQSTPVYTPPQSYSDEQLAIIKSTADVVVGQAFAGTGKSTTGIGYAVHNPDKRILVICFNQANAVESRAKYGAIGHPNVDVCTTHALALRYLGAHQRARIAQRWNAITLRNELPMVGGRGDMRTTAITASLLSEFFITTDAQIDPVLHGDDARDRLHASDTSISQCVGFAKRLWLAMNSDSPVNGMRTTVNTISIPHDAYLKMFVMSAGNLGYDTVIFDEAQDANPVMLQLLKSQYSTGSKVIMLGDRHQSIYAFRGAVNALEDRFLPAGSHVLPLTQSWRFGPKTANMANCILRELKGEAHPIKGMGSDENYRKGQPLTYLSRTNADLLRRAAAVDGKGVQWVGGIQNYRVGILNDVWLLKCADLENIADQFIKKNFRSWEDFEQAAEIDNESSILLDMVETYDSEIPELVKKLESNAQQTAILGNADIVLATGHKAKGLEWNHVKISDDFRGVFNSAENWLAGNADVFPEQEVNLLYVAITRAKHHAMGNHEMAEWLHNLPEHRTCRVRSFAQNTGNGKKFELEPSPSTAHDAFQNVKRPVFRAG